MRLRRSRNRRAPGGNAGTSQIVAGQSGADTIFGSTQDDVLDGALGQDEIRGNDGNDTIFGGTCNGGTGTTDTATCETTTGIP